MRRYRDQLPYRQITTNNRCLPVPNLLLLLTNMSSQQDSSKGSHSGDVPTPSGSSKAFDQFLPYGKIEVNVVNESQPKTTFREPNPLISDEDSPESTPYEPPSRFRPSLQPPQQPAPGPLPPLRPPTLLAARPQRSEFTERNPYQPNDQRMKRFNGKDATAYLKKYEEKNRRWGMSRSEERRVGKECPV